ncbi:MAG TPA: asparagine synthase-related protein [Thermohalobaculum sp.]|nr:asparagine synthase-related protein [Thermohalobaculum sp.]
MTQLICGILRLDGTPSDLALVGRMAASMIATGLRPETRLASRGPVAMAAIRLVPTGAGPEPIAPALIDGDDTLLVADISIYDHARTQLSIGEADHADVTFLRHLLVRRGAGALGNLHGDFAFAAWRDGCLTLGRDHFGARSVVYVERPGRYLAFASSPVALLRTELASSALDEELVASWMLQPSPPPGRTIYRDIRPVDAAHLVECRPGGAFGAATTRRYWRLDTSRRLPFDSDPSALAAETARLLTQAVERRLPPVGPGAGHLSGGLDSSPIAVLAARMLSRVGRSFYAYTYREPEHGPGLPGQGDAPIADLVAAAEPNITQVPVIGRGLFAAWLDGIEPETLLPLSSREPEEQVLRHASEHGARVILSGWGGDQIVSYQGRGAEFELLRAGRLIRLWRHLRAEAQGGDASLARLFLSTVVMQGLPQKLREAVRRLAGRETPFLTTMASFARMVAPHRRHSLLIEPWADEGDSHQIRRGTAEAWYIQTRLEAFARQGARHGIAYAFPLLDLDLVKYSMQIPGIFLRAGGRRRVLFREALAGILPDAVRYTPSKLSPFPGEKQRTAADRERLLVLLQQWGNNARIRDFLDLEFMTEVVRSATDPNAPADQEFVDLTPACQIAVLLTALEDYPFDRLPLTETPMHEMTMNEADE